MATTTGGGGSDGGGVYNPAPDPSPVNQIDWAGMASAFSSQASSTLTNPTNVDAHVSRTLKEHAAKAAFNQSRLPQTAGDVENFLAKWAAVIANGVLDAILTVLDPIRDGFANVASHYVDTFVGSMTGHEAGKAATAGGTIHSVAQSMYSSIISPLLGLTAGADPAQIGAGQSNVQTILGSVMALHMNQWTINCLSNISGLGYLHFLGNFDDVVTAGVNTRAISRMAFKPYLQQFVVAPLTRDLNSAHRIALAPYDALLRAYAAGTIDAARLDQLMAQHGYDAETIALMIPEHSKPMALEDVAWLVNTQYWTDEQGQEYLQSLGYPASLVNVVLFRAKFKELEPIEHEIVHAYLGHISRGEGDSDALNFYLKTTDIPQFQQDAYNALAAVLGHRIKRLNYGQVVAAYKRGFLDLGYVTDWLTTEGYSQADVTTLTLMDFAEASEAQLTAAKLGATYRERQAVDDLAAQAATAKGQTAKAAALANLAAKYDALAKHYGS